MSAFGSATAKRRNSTWRGPWRSTKARTYSRQKNGRKSQVSCSKAVTDIAGQSGGSWDSVGHVLSAGRPAPTANKIAPDACLLLCVRDICGYLTSHEPRGRDRYRRRKDRSADAASTPHAPSRGSAFASTVRFIPCLFPHPTTPTPDTNLPHLRSHYHSVNSALPLHRSDAVLPVGWKYSCGC